ncbi:hypothetical protein MAPG_04017 [Magnaporthiopsis poae ATCC 64411]|uniref:Tat pathway signal sequence n=1 Tax=Magnaporthiopsis poae (strain ATCC 64411 / 73-15) TaxID=644358 RepID=A0A0C4DVL0_MAGP6|nr:hypothetical protein MAPG_04017 [Magnaporthiopsis poae ATCC 64411]
MSVTAHKNAEYSPLAATDCQSEPHDDIKLARGSILAGCKPRLPIVGIATFFVLSNLVCCLFGTYIGRFAQPVVDLDRKCSFHTSEYSPILSEVGVKYADISFNGSFMRQNIYRRPASPEVDAAWEALGADYRPGIVSNQQGTAAGLGSHHVQRSDKFGGGFFVNVEGLHHLHCLNLVRKGLYYNVQYYKDLGTHAFLNDEHILQLHISHCLDTVRQALMCNVDTGLLGQVWYNPKNVTPFPDFNTKHKCKNFDAIREWAKGIQAPPQNELPRGYLKMPDPHHILPTTP